MPIDHETLRQRIQSVIDADDGLTVRNASIASGSDSWLHKFMTLPNASMRLSQLNKLAEALDVTTEWLLFGDQPRPTVSEEQIDALATAALDEIQPGMSLAEIRPAVASKLRAQLRLVLSGQLSKDSPAEPSAPDTGVRSAPATKESAQAG